MEAKKKETRGRKKIEDKVDTVCVYIRQSVITELGGKPIIQRLAEKYINDLVKEIKKSTI